MKIALIVLVVVACVGVLIVVVPRLADLRPGSYRSQFARSRDSLLARPVAAAPIVSEADITALPPLMQTYLRRVGAVGRERPHNVRLEFDAQMRSSATSPWMKSTASQYEFFVTPARLFYMNASLAGIPFDVFHRYVDGAATFRVRIGSLFPMVDKSGPALTNDETVTLMNDILVFAPAAVLSLPFTFEATGPHTLRSTFSNAGFTVAAVLTFDEPGDLVGFTSDDRAHSNEAGPATWSTPLSGYRELNGIRVSTTGDANWIDRTGEWTYGKFALRSIAYNVVK